MIFTDLKDRFLLLRERNRKKEFFKTELWVRTVFHYFVQVSVLSVMVVGFFKVIANNGSVSDFALYTAMKRVGVADILTLLVVVFGASYFKGVSRVGAAVLVIHTVVLVVSTRVFQIISPDLIFSEQVYGVQIALSSALVLLLVSLLGVPINVIFVLLDSMFNQGPASKTDAVQPAPAASDLARDLRLSRSHARRHRGTRRY